MEFSAETKEILKNHDVNVYEGYSGRFMFGSTVDGIVISDMSEIASITELAFEYKLNDLKKFLDGFRTDNLGYDYILY